MDVPSNQSPLPCSNLRMRAIFALALFVFSLAPLQAQQPPAPVRQAIENWLRVQTQGLPGEVSFEVGSLDPANRLSPCPAFDVSHPPGAQTWGRTNVMVRCLSEAGWRVFVPVHIRVRAGYLVSARPIAQGQIVAPEDLMTQVGDLSDLPANILTDQSLAVGREAGSSIPAGRPLRADMLRAVTVVRQGQNVRLISRGPGFTVSTEGRALGNAVAGRVVQIRLANGQVVSGIAKDDGVVEVSY